MFYFSTFNNGEKGRYHFHIHKKLEQLIKTFECEKLLLLKLLQNTRSTIKWIKVFKNGRSKIFKRLSSTNFTWSFLEYLDPNIAIIEKKEQH